MNRFCIAAAATALVLVLPSQARAQRGDALQQGLTLLDMWAEATVAQRAQPGLALGIVLGDQLVWSGEYGFADVERRVPVTPETLFPIGSITKSFTAVGILQLRDQGRLRLDDSLDDHLPWVRIASLDDEAHGVTLRELLMHASGLQREVPGTVWTAPVMPPVDSIRASLSQAYPSAEHWKYSNLGFSLLGQVISTSSNQSWDDFIRTGILEPLGMSSTRTRFNQAGNRLATGYEALAVPGRTRAPVGSLDLGPLAPAGAIASNVRDLAKYLTAQMNVASGSVLSAPSLREMQRPQWLMDDWQAAYGYGLVLRRVDNRLRVGHPGSVPGYGAMMEFIPSLRLGAIAMVNSQDGAADTYVNYALQLLSPIVARMQSAATPSTALDASRFVGRYEAEDRRGFMLVAMLDGELSLLSPLATDPYSARFVLEPLNEPNAFLVRAPRAFSYDPFGERLTFDVDDNGVVIGYRTANYRYLRVPEAN